MAADLASIGVSGHASDAMLKETAHARHVSRATFARHEAIEWVFSDSPSLRDRVAVGEAVVVEHVDRVVAAIAWADAIGVGGTDGVTGDATERHAAFSACGKGRKHASDGPAWDAAIAELRRGHMPWVYIPCVSVIGASLAFGVPDSDTDISYITPELIPLAWQYVIARHGLGRAVEREAAQQYGAAYSAPFGFSYSYRGEYDSPAPRLPVVGTARDWSAVCNTIYDQMIAAAQKATGEAERLAAERHDYEWAIAWDAAMRATVTWADALRVGACQAGVESFVRRHTDFPVASADWWTAKVPLSLVARHEPEWATKIVANLLTMGSLDLSPRSDDA